MSDLSTKIADLPRSKQQEMLKLLTPKMTKYIIHRPYPKQAAFMLLDTEEAFYGGAAGGGKSDALLMCALQYVDVPGYSAIIFRKSYADLVKPGALIDRALNWLAPWLATKEVRWIDKEKKFVFPSGAILQFGYMETYKDRLNYQGGEYQFVGFDEVTHFIEGCYTYLFSRMRRLEGVDIPLRVRAASNPPDDEDNAEWVYNRFVNPETKKKDVIFIPAGLEDNPHLDVESYKKTLENLDPVTRARLREGVWTLTRKGNMFKRHWFREVEMPTTTSRRRVRFWDCAATDVEREKKRKGKEADYTVGLLISEVNGLYIIEDIFREKLSSLGVEQQQRALAVQDGFATLIREEQEPGSSGDYTITKKKADIFKRYNYEGVRSTGSKIERAKHASAAAERGIICYAKGCRNIDILMDELEQFPGGLHDDTVDGLSGAFNALYRPEYDDVPLNVTAASASYWDSFGAPDDGVEIRDSILDYSGSYWNI